MRLLLEQAESIYGWGAGGTAAPGVRQSRRSVEGLGNAVRATIAGQGVSGWRIWKWG